MRRSLLLFFVFILTQTGFTQINGEWQQCVGTEDNETAKLVIKSRDGGYLIAAETHPFANDFYNYFDSIDILIFKLDSTLNIEWEKTISGSAEDHVYSIQQTEQGDFIIAGGTYSNDGDFSENHGGSDIWIAKFNEDGEEQWIKCFGGSSFEQYWGEIVLSDSGFSLISTTSSNNGDVSGNHGSNDIWMMHLNYSGEILWQKCFGGSNKDLPQELQNLIMDT